VTIQKVVNLTFAGEGIDVISVGDGNSAMDILRERLPDLVMADVNMPGVNGYEICEKVKSMDPEGKLPVVLLVGSFEPFDSEEAARVRADSHLTKPFESIAVLVDTVHALLGVGSEVRRFDDTVEYPTGSDLVVDAGIMGFAGGFEDDTIEAEQMGTVEEAPESVEPAPVESYGFDTGENREGEESASAFAAVGYEQSQERPSEPERDEFSYGSETYDEREAANSVEAPADYKYESGEYAEPEMTPSEDAGGTYTDFIDNREESPTVVEEDEFSPVEPEPASYASEEAISPEQEQREEPASSDFYYREESYFKSTEYSEAASIVEPEEERFEAEAFEPEQPVEDDEASFAPVTVELDELELLELPIDRSAPESGDEPPVFSSETEDQFAATIREPNFAPPAPSEVSGSEIPADLVDEIARRVVEKLTEKAVREIAWEVVPDMAEIIIRKMMEERLND
jgi:CheY-like chemotaxis protein